MPEPCHYCGQPVRISKDNHRTQHVDENGTWTYRIWHQTCDPFIVRVVVERKDSR
jgi:hypothetical protein